ncbi:histone-lysine N-methyltransferase NSD2 isoform X2 [Gouania willdenowi]|uniref:histone-lysine N-methyltransferase NSD2 isoform X2 n=1 Tax=Gouania willdenowi TaxID=441366 RepID=UPI00105476EA|nr:histone-lysine N-methyltransferase NSD2 isoform X2 [Gouania willdenowi]
MDCKGSSLPSMPEPANPVSMKQPAESLSVHKGHCDVGSDPAMLAATLQDSVLQTMTGHNNHDRLKDLTSRMLNGDQDSLPKLCSQEPSMPKTNGLHQQHNCTPVEPELKVGIPQVLPLPVFEPCCVNGTSLDTDADNTLCGPDELQDTSKQRGKLPKLPPQADFNASLKPLDSLRCSNAAEEAGVTTKSLLQPDFTLEVMKKEVIATLPMNRFSVGDLVWTKVSGYPWWPCMVTTDPEVNNHVKQKPNARSRLGLLYHVQYFGNAPERGYTFEKNMVFFTGVDQYQELSQSRKRSVSTLNHKRTSLSVPRKLQAQWDIGVVQAKEALGLSADSRLEKFSFLYDQDGPHLHPEILQKLKPELNHESGPETEHWISTTLPYEPLVSPVKASASPLSLKRVQKVPMRNPKAGKRQRKGKSLQDGNPSSAADAQSGSSVPQRRKRKPKEAQLLTKTVRRRKKSDDMSDPVRKRQVSDNGSKDGLLPEAKPVKRGRKRKLSMSLTDTNMETDQQPKKRRRIRKETQALTSEGTDKKQRRRKKTDVKNVKEPKRRLRKPKALLSDGQDAEKPKRRRRRKQDGENQALLIKVKKRQASPCVDTEGSGSEGRPDSPSDSLDGMKKGERKKEFVCQICEQAGENLVACEGQCCGMFHLHCLGPSIKSNDKLLCTECSSGLHSCFHCKQSEGEVRRCHVQQCGKFYHEACVRLNPLTVFDNRGFRCPLHTCLSCHYGCRSKHKSAKGRLMRCLRCPVAYHVGDLCVAAGSEMITNTAIVCTNHFNAKKGYSHHSHVNVSWCFVCSKGGQLLCCESCPAAFHPDCLNIAMPEGSWYCNDCRAGKKPKYRDIIWVKLGMYRWWPAEILHPKNIPTNIQHLRHQIGEFPVFFFGSRDYFWTHQGRVFPYMEGDRGSKNQRTGVGKVFKNALSEAEARFKEIKLKKEEKEAQQSSKKPPPYKFIKVNKPFGRVQVYTADISEIPKCNCKPSVERPCGFESECLNRMLQYECHPQVCPSGERCCNQDFSQRLYPDTKIIKTPGKGWGLVSFRDIRKGEFVNEYIGELIDEEECRARIKYAHENNITDFYMLTIDKDRIIDAGPKGNYSRFMNHSCQPNCETQKWTVNGDTRVGLFAVCDISAGTELTFNYNLDCLGNEKTACRCGAPNCSGFLGDRPKSSNSQSAEPKAKRLKRKTKRRKVEGKKKSEDECFRCGDGGQLVLCGKKTCTKAFHLSCLNLTKRPFGRWDCPWHHCDVCGKRSEAFCQLCPNSFCKHHQEGALHSWLPTGQLCCSEHEELNNPGSESSLNTNAGAAPVVRAAKVSKPRGRKRKAAEA